MIGCSVAYHLAHIGWQDIVLLERKQLTSGTTWHAAGLIAQLRATANMTRLAKYSQELYGELAAQLAPHVDLLIGETIASVGHARALLEAARETGLPVWLAVTVDDEDGSLLRSREPLSDLADLDADAWLANCSTPEATGAAMEVFAGFGKPFGAYANGFVEINKDFLNATSVVDILAGRDIDPESYADFALGWVSQGATIVGGCCEIGPNHIRELARRLRAEGHTIV